MSSNHVIKTLTTIYGDVQTALFCQNDMHFYLARPGYNVLKDRGGERTGLVVRAPKTWVRSSAGSV